MPPQTPTTRVTRVTHDQDSPDFPHGEDRGYSRGCRQPCCMRAHAILSKRKRCGYRTRTDAAPVRAHLLTLAEASGSLAAIARTVGMDTSTVQNLALGAYRTVSKDNARALLNLRPQDVSPGPDVVVRRNGERVVLKQPYVDQVRRLQAAGHSMRVISEELGLTGVTPKWVNTGSDYINTDTAAAVAALYRRLENVAGTSNRAKGLAKRMGYYPPAHYDEDGTLNLRSIPGHPWSVLDLRCARSLQVAQILLADHTAHRRIVGEQVGLSDRHVARIAKFMGLYVDSDKATVQAVRDRFAPTLEEWQYDDLDTVVAAFRLGLVTSLFGPGVTSEERELLHEHPGYRAWLDEYHARAQHSESYEVAA